MNPESGFRIVYVGPSRDAAYWGYAQANFVLRWENRSGREVAVSINTPALEYLASQVGIELNDDTRDELAMLIGHEVLKEFESGNVFVEPDIVVSKATLTRNPALIEGVRGAMQFAS